MSLPICQCGEVMTVGHACQFRHAPQPSVQPLPDEDDIERLLPVQRCDLGFTGVPVQAPELFGLPAADTEEDEWETIIRGSRRPRPRPV